MHTVFEITSPFAAAVTPGSVLALVESRGNLISLSSRVCRPLDKPLLGVARAGVSMGPDLEAELDIDDDFDDELELEDDFDGWAAQDTTISAAELVTSLS